MPGLQEKLAYHGVLLALLTKEGTEALIQYFWTRTFTSQESYEDDKERNKLFQDFVTSNEFAEKQFWNAEEKELFSLSTPYLRLEDLSFVTLVKIIENFVATPDSQIAPTWWDFISEDEEDLNRYVKQLISLHKTLIFMPDTRMTSDTFEKHWQEITTSLLYLKSNDGPSAIELYDSLRERCLNLETHLDYLELLQNLYRRPEAQEADEPANDDGDDSKDDYVDGEIETDSIPLKVLNVTNVFAEDMKDPSLPVLGKLGAIRKLGSGGFGYVWLYRDIESGMLVAVKQGVQHSQSTIQALKLEIGIMRKLKHKNVVRYFGARVMNYRLSLVMEYLPRGSVADQVKAHGALTEKSTRKLTKQILDGTAYLHSQLIIHRDIKGANVLLTDKYRAKLTDFGLSWKMMDHGSLPNDRIGTIYYMAPEVARGEPYGTKADIWSIGCTILEMMTTTPPWALEASYAEDILFMIANFPPIYSLSSAVSMEMKTFIKKIFLLKSFERPTARELLLDPAMIIVPS